MPRTSSPSSLTKMISANDNTRPKDAWVIFSGDTDISWLKILKPGFRHCFILTQDNQHWLALDSLSHYLEMAILPVAVDFHLPQWFASQNHHIAKATINRSINRPAPLAMMSCVEIAKRYLGIHNRFIVTPWQLYHHLTTLNNERT